MVTDACPLTSDTTLPALNVPRVVVKVTVPPEIGVLIFSIVAVIVVLDVPLAGTLAVPEITEMLFGVSVKLTATELVLTDPLPVVKVAVTVV